MLPMKPVRLALGELLAAAAAFLAPAIAANKIALIAAPFNPTETMTPASLTLATFTGSTPKAGAVGAQQAGINPATAEQVITILAPLGGWRWECTAAPVAPEGIFGYALISDDDATLLAVKLLDTPVSIAAVGDFIDLGAVEFRVVLQPLS